MIIFPAVDLQGGKAVRLRQGRADDTTVFSEDPVATALHWQNQGAKWLHLVDLDGAFQGQGVNTATVRAICRALEIPVQLGGGVRDEAAVRRWLEDVRHRVDEVTYQGYEVQARAHILPYFDDLQIRLCDVDGETLQTYINVKAKFGRSDGHGGLSLRQHKNVLNQTLKLAQRDGLIQTNPADLVVMPHAAQFTGTFYTEAQMRDLLTAVKNERLYPIIYVTALYGLRRSEVLGLKWDSINFAMQTLTIRHTVARVTKVVEKNKTKNASSFRSFPLTDDAVRLFKILLQQEQIYRNHFGKDYIDNDYVFTWEDEHPYSPDYVSHTFHKLLKKYDLPHIRFHDLRHTCASMLLSEGYGLKDVQEWLGHSDIKMTANIYGHLDIRRKRSIANGLEQALPRLKP